MDKMKISIDYELMKIIVDLIKDNAFDKIIPRKFKEEWDKIDREVHSWVERDDNSVFNQADKRLPLDGLPD